MWHCVCITAPQWPPIWTEMECNNRSVSPRKEWIVFSTSSPPAVQRVPWPAVEGSNANANAQTGHDMWVINDEELPWLVDADGTPRYESLYSRATHLTKDSSYYMRNFVSQADGLRDVDHVGRPGIPRTTLRGARGASRRLGRQCRR